ncbi:hypothetical protein N431DRAFT_433741 [Stipitochalara longipes BDJ]|nr:hypothetical protein N431DRAFT_433741 [Stipitochalara longipes BDJ]
MIRETRVTCLVTFLAISSPSTNQKAKAKDFSKRQNAQRNGHESRFAPTEYSELKLAQARCIAGCIASQKWLDYVPYMLFAASIIRLQISLNVTVGPGIALQTRLSRSLYG